MVFLVEMFLGVERAIFGISELQRRSTAPLPAVRLGCGHVSPMSREGRTRMSALPNRIGSPPTPAQ